MKHLSKSSIPKILLFISALFFIFSCSSTKSTTKPTPPVEPSIEQVQKEQPSEAAPPPEPIKGSPSKPKEAPALTSPPPPSTPKIPPPAPSLHVTEVIWTSVNLREGPGMNYKVVGNIKKGTSLKILEVKGSWLRVQLQNGTEAWVSKTATTEAPKAPPASSSVPLPM